MQSASSLATAMILLLIGNARMRPEWACPGEVLIQAPAMLQRELQSLPEGAEQRLGNHGVASRAA